MCTAVYLQGERPVFGRTLDLEYHYDEQVVLTPRRFAFSFRYEGACACHHAILGTAHVCCGQPLYYDAMNEQGLAVAALHFPDCGCYHPPVSGKRALCSFEVIPYLLARCSCVQEAVDLLRACVVTPDAFSADLPPTPLHWMIADARSCVVVESLARGLVIYENTLGVMTNAPEFSWQEKHLARYAGLDAYPRTGGLGKELSLSPVAKGSGAVGLPGDYTSPARFVRAAFAKTYTQAVPGEDAVSRFFHVMESVSVPSGCVRTEQGACVRTVYTACSDLARGAYRLHTYEDRVPRGVSFHDLDLTREGLQCFSMQQSELPSAPKNLDSAYTDIV